MTSSSGQATDAASIGDLLSDYALTTSFADLPEAVRSESVRALVNWAGCALGGARTTTVDAAVAAARRLSPNGSGRLMGRRERLEPADAAQVNCLSSAAHAFDDTHLATITHPTGPVLSALLAVSETRRVGGEDFLLALMLGMEIECRLSAVITAPGSGASPGLYITGVTGGIGAAAAVGRVLGLEPAQMVSALGLAAAQACGNRGTHASMACAFVPAAAARCGFVAAFQAGAGMTCGAAALAGRHGLLEVVAPRAEPDRIIDALGTRFESLGNAYKPYPCGIVIHPIIDACLQLARPHPPDVSAIESLALVVSTGALTLTWRKLPSSVLEAQVSLYHWAAAALVFGEAGLTQGALACIEDDRVRSMQERITATADPTLAIDQAVASLRLRDGSEREVRIEHATGSVARPMTDEELAAKFRAQARGILGEVRAGRLLESCLALHASDDVAEILDLAMPDLEG